MIWRFKKFIITDHSRPVRAGWEICRSLSGQVVNQDFSLQVYSVQGLCSYPLSSSASFAPGTQLIFSWLTNKWMINLLTISQDWEFLQDGTECSVCLSTNLIFPYSLTGVPRTSKLTGPSDTAWFPTFTLAPSAGYFPLYIYTSGSSSPTQVLMSIKFSVIFVPW